jgi:hypothetical protein
MLVPDSDSVDATPSPPAVWRPPAGPGWMSKRAASGQNLIYVSNYNEIVIFPNESGATPIGTISDGVTNAYGLFVDTQINLYVCNSSFGTVVVYPPGQTSPSFTYSTGLTRPLYAVADSSRLFVGNASGGQIVEYALGNGQPQYTLHSLGSEVDGITLDADGNLYAAYRNKAKGGIEYFAQGTGTGTDLGIKLKAPQGLLVASNGDLYVAETQGANTIAGFHPGKTKPFARAPKTSYAPTQIQFDAPEQNLYDSNLDGRVDQIGFPGLRSVTPYISDDSVLTSVQGFALSPPAPQ